MSKKERYVHLYVYDGNEFESYDHACRCSKEKFLELVEISQLEKTIKMIETLNYATSSRLNVGIEVFLHSDRDSEGNLL